jgi:hypothetical protein
MLQATVCSTLPSDILVDGLVCGLVAVSFRRLVGVRLVGGSVDALVGRSVVGVLVGVLVDIRNRNLD